MRVGGAEWAVSASSMGFWGGGYKNVPNGGDWIKDGAVRGETETSS